MQFHHSLEQLNLPASWVTIGSFDGVHLGHQTVIRSMVEGARAAGIPSVVISFNPHPAVYLRGIKEAFYLTDPQERAQLIGQLGADHVITLSFDQALAEQTAEVFMQHLEDHLGLRQLWIGADFRLGKDRQGTPERLSEIGRELGYLVKVVPHFDLEGTLISSSRIRKLLAQGEVEQVAQMLTRPYRVTGEVVHGDSRGRELGIPTANLQVKPDRIIPMRGVYATLARIKNHPFLSVTNIGLRPTFEKSSTLRIETHLLDFDKMIYHEKVTLEFFKLLRTEQKFLSKYELINQLKLDINQARKVLADAQSAPGISARP